MSQPRYGRWLLYLWFERGCRSDGSIGLVIKRPVGDNAPAGDRDRNQDRGHGLKSEADCGKFFANSNGRWKEEGTNVTH